MLRVRRTRRLHADANGFSDFELQGVEIRDEIVELLLVERVALRRHHAAAVDNRLLDEPVVGGQAARQESFFVDSLQARPFASR